MNGRSDKASTPYTYTQSENNVTLICERDNTNFTVDPDERSTDRQYSPIYKPRTESCTIGTIGTMASTGPTPGGPDGIAGVLSSLGGIA